MRVASLVLAVLAAGGATSAAAQAHLRAGPGSRIVINGTSNLHAWDCYTTAISASFEGSSGAAADVGRDARSLSASIPVESIDCGSGTMTRNLRSALHADAHPSIEFRMTSYAATATRGGGAYDATVKGRLTVNGVERPVQLKATVIPDGTGGARAEGSTEIRITDFGVRPVRALMGSLRTGDRVTLVLTIVGVPR